MKRYRYFVLGAIALVILSTSAIAFRGVLDGGFNLFDIEHDEVLSYNFDDITDSCTMHTDINLSDMSYCSYPEREAFLTFTSEFNWSLLCCEFSSKCYEHNVTNSSEVCENNDNGTYTGYTYNNNGLWLAYCCDEDGQNCYVDTHVSPSDDSTVCDNDYTFNTMSLTSTGTWDGVCCVGGKTG